MAKTPSGLSESFEVDGRVVKVSGKSRDISFKKTPSIKKCQAEKKADTNQVGTDFYWKPATFDNPDHNAHLYLSMN